MYLCGDIDKRVSSSLVTLCASKAFATPNKTSFILFTSFGYCFNTKSAMDLYICTISNADISLFSFAIIWALLKNIFTQSLSSNSALLVVFSSSLKSNSSKYEDKRSIKLVNIADICTVGFNEHTAVKKSAHVAK